MPQFRQILCFMRISTTRGARDTGRAHSPRVVLWPGFLLSSQAALDAGPPAVEKKAGHLGLVPTHPLDGSRSAAAAGPDPPAPVDPDAVRLAAGVVPHGVELGTVLDGVDLGNSPRDKALGLGPAHEPPPHQERNRRPTLPSQEHRAVAPGAAAPGAVARKEW